VDASAGRVGASAGRVGASAMGVALLAGVFGLRRRR
jgi:hypothetical protein